MAEFSAVEYAGWAGRLSHSLREMLDHPDKIDRRVAREALSEYDAWREQRRQALAPRLAELDPRIEAHR